MAKFNNAPLLSHAEVAQLIAAIGHKRTVLVQGENGIGKSALLHSLKLMPQFKNHLFPAPVDCAQLDVGDHIIPVPDFERGTTRGLPNERYGVHKDNQKGINNAVPVVSMLDEMAKAPKHIQATLAPWFYDRRLGSYAAPEGSIVFGTTNLNIEGLGDFMPAHTRNRIVIVTMRKPTADEWVNEYAIPHNLAPEVSAFVSKFPHIMDSFMDYEAGGKHQGKNQSKENPYIFDPRIQQDAYATPRSLHAASDIIKTTMQLPIEVQQAALIGTVGVATGRELESFVRFGRDLPDFDRVWKDPTNCPLPTHAVAQVVQVFQLVTQTQDRTQADGVVKYVKRMKDEMQCLFCNTAANNNEKVAKFAMLDEFRKLLDAHRIFFTGSK